MGTPVLLLASGSPRRRSLLQGLGIEPLVVIPETDETWRGGDPVTWAGEIAAGKVAAALPLTSADWDLALGADTIVLAAGRVLGKPRDEEEAAEMLSLLSGATHEVVTAVHLRTAADRSATFHEVTRVTFRTIPALEIGDYIATGEPMDKAGAYGAQGYGAMFITGVQGCFFNVVGLPIARLSLQAQALGHGLWSFRS
jgi:septum formation protein